MKNNKYKVCRDNIYVGEVVIPTSKVEMYLGETEILNIKPRDLMLYSYVPSRSILFVPDSQKYTNDLLYNSPSYPILNLTNKDTLLKTQPGDIIVKDALNLSQLLKYFNYNEELSYKDILKIRKLIFSGRFAQDHCELFGMKEVTPEEYICYKNNVEITDHIELKKYRNAIKKMQQMGERRFIKTSPNILPDEYWILLDSKGDKQPYELINAQIAGIEPKANAFTPIKEIEGKIKKLTRF